jgi:ceramide glucosyltransferase
MRLTWEAEWRSSARSFVWTPDSALTFLSIVAALWWAASCIVFLMSLIGAVLQPFVQRRRATCQDHPAVSLILPVKLLNPGFEQAQRSAFRQDYPDYEILFSSTDKQSPALDVVQELIENFPDRQARILQSTANIAASPKMNNLVAPLAAARHDVIVTKDSNITLDADTIQAFMRNFTPGVGLVCAVPVAVRSENFAAQIEALMVNAHARILLTVSMLGCGFGVGKVMLFRRSDLEKLGGIPAVSDTIAEDSAIAKGFASLGLKTRFAHRTAAQEIGRRNLQEIYQRQARWAVIRRAMEPWTFPVEPLYNSVVTALAAALAAPLIGLPPALAAAGSLAFWFVAEIGVAALKGWEVSFWSPLAFLGREIVSLMAWLHAWTTRDVVWANKCLHVYNGERR